MFARALESIAVFLPWELVPVSAWAPKPSLIDAPVDRDPEADNCGGNQAWIKPAELSATLRFDAKSSATEAFI